MPGLVLNTEDPTEQRQKYLPRWSFHIVKGNKIENEQVKYIQLYVRW